MRIKMWSEAFYHGNRLHIPDFILGVFDMMAERWEFGEIEYWKPETGTRAAQEGREG